MAKGLGTLICFKKKLKPLENWGYMLYLRIKEKPFCLPHTHVRVFEFRPPHSSKARWYAVVIFYFWTSWLSCILLIQVQLLIYFMLKYAMEILLSESSVITNHYFSWNTSAVAIFLAILGLTVLPVNAVVGTYISNMFEDRFVDFSCLSTSMAYDLFLFVLLGILPLVSDQRTIRSLLLYRHLELCPFLYFGGKPTALP